MSLLSAAASHVIAADNSSCIERKVAFDGIRTLHYSVVLGESAEAVPIYSQYPSDCPGDSATCQASSLATPGDAVAVAKTCGPWSYVQRVGADAVVTGWLQTKRLKDRGANVPFDAGEPGGRDRPREWPAPYRVRVELTEGKGVPVCEAYLQRLNQTVFHEPPSCGRPENAQVPGFAHLNRVPLTPAQVNGNYVTAVNSTSQTSDNNKLIAPPASRGDLAAIAIEAGGPAREVKALVNPADISVWRFEPPVDIDNDGHPDNVVIWRDFPPSWSWGGYSDSCGVFVDATRPIAGSVHVPFIFTEGYKSIDIEKTVELFGDPAPVPSYQQQQPIRPYGTSVDIFEYAGKYYFDTTKDGDGANVLYDNNIYVYLREGGVTRAVCKLRNLDPRGWPAL